VIRQLSSAHTHLSLLLLLLLLLLLVLLLVLLLLVLLLLQGSILYCPSICPKLCSPVEEQEVSHQKLQLQISMTTSLEVRKQLLAAALSLA
jgi:hypothetical protein